MCVARSPSYASTRLMGSVLNGGVLYGRVEHELDARSFARRGEGALPLRERDDLRDQRLQHHAVVADQLERAAPRPRGRGIAARDRELAVADPVERDRDRAAGEP